MYVYKYICMYVYQPKKADERNRSKPAQSVIGSVEASLGDR